MITQGNVCKHRLDGDWVLSQEDNNYTANIELKKSVDYSLQGVGPWHNNKAKNPRKTESVQIGVMQVLTQKNELYGSPFEKRLTRERTDTKFGTPDTKTSRHARGSA